MFGRRRRYLATDFATFRRPGTGPYATSARMSAMALSATSPHDRFALASGPNRITP